MLDTVAKGMSPLAPKEPTAPFPPEIRSLRVGINPINFYDAPEAKYRIINPESLHVDGL